MNTEFILKKGTIYLEHLSNHIFDVLTITKPTSIDSALNLTKVISKLSPLLGNLIEFNTVEFLNTKSEFQQYGSWIRQDPGFPDTIFIGNIDPKPGFEIKAWFPLATEITARFKDSQNHFINDQTYVCLLSWLPEKIIYGKPKIIAVSVFSGQSIAKARDDHYHNPPDYLVLEPEDTTERTQNLQQTNTNGYKWQSTNPNHLNEAQLIVESWGQDGKKYKPTVEYQQQLRELLRKFSYRLDTNYAKMDRIEHEGVEEFKKSVLEKNVCGYTITEWTRLFSSSNEDIIKEALSSKLDIKRESIEKTIK